MSVRIASGRLVSRMFAAACAVCVACAAGGCSSGTPALSEAEPAEARVDVSDDALVSPGTLTVTYGTDDAPMTMEDEEGEVTGYAADVAGALADELGLTVSFVEGGTDEVGKGEADVCLCISLADAPEGIDVTGSVFTEGTAVFALGEDAAAPTADDLADARIAVQTGSASQEALAAASVVGDQVPCANVNECFEELSDGEVDYAVCDASAGGYLARLYPDVSYVGLVGDAEVLGVGVAADNDELADAIGAAVSDVSTNGVLEAVYAAWFGSMPVDLTSTQLPGIEIDESRLEQADDEDADESDSDDEASAADKDDKDDDRDVLSTDGEAPEVASNAVTAEDVYGVGDEDDEAGSAADGAEATDEAGQNAAATRSDGAAGTGAAGQGASGTPRQ